jgi:hypothetical protein
MRGLGPAISLVMGGATILFHDPRFVMLKPTLIPVSLKPGWMIPPVEALHLFPGASKTGGVCRSVQGWIYRGPRNK